MPELKENASLPAGRSKTRWNAINKDVLYLDFRAEISAFDKAFYKEDKNKSRVDKRKQLRRQSKKLKIAISEKIESQKSHGYERIFKNYIFSPVEIELVNKIVGNDYQEITYIEHDYYLSGSFSIYLKKGNDQIYSEAFAGSGETSVVRLVYALERAEEKTLVLLDEPETSLHIEAQYKLQQYILEKIKEKHLQVVISTHSPFFAKNLPDCAIKILKAETELEGKINIFNSAAADESSFHLGYRSNHANKINVYVEDKLAQAIVNRVCKDHLSESDNDLLSINPYAGGDSALIKLAGIESSKQQSNIALLFDGDCEPSESIPNQTQIPESEEGNLESKIKSLFGSCPPIPSDSNNMAQKIKNYRNFLDFALKRFKYLPFKTPEAFLVENCEELKNRGDKKDPKECIKNYVKEQIGSSGGISAENIISFQRQLLSKVPKNHSGFKSIADTLRHFITLRSPSL